MIHLIKRRRNIESAYVNRRTILRYSESNKDVTLKSGLGVVQDHSRWRRSIDYIRLTIGLPL